MWPAFHELNQTLLRRRIQHVEILDLRLQTKLFELRRNPFRIVFVIWRADVVRTRRKPLHIRAMIFRIRNGSEFFFPLPFRARRFRAESKKRRFVSRGGVKKWHKSRYREQTTGDQNST